MKLNIKSKLPITTLISFIVAPVLIIGLIIAAVFINADITSKRQEDTNNFLKNLTVGNYTLMPQFDKSVLSYTVTVLDKIDHLEISAIPDGQNVTVKILYNENFTKGNNVVLIKTISPNGSERVYEISVEYNPFSGSDDKVKGNWGKNLMGGGIAAAANDYFYYLNHDKQIVRERTDKSFSIVLSQENCSHINVVGDWVYYISDYTVYKVRTNGADRQALKNNNTGKDIYARYMMVYDGYLYYSNATSAVDIGYLHRLPLDYDEDTNPERINSHIPYQFIIWDDIIYYINERNGDNFICSVSVEGDGTSTVINKAVTKFNIGNEEGKIYFISEEDGHLYSANIQEPFPELILENVSDFIIDGDYIICSFNDGTAYACKKDNLSEKIKICDGDAESFSIVGGYVYFNLTDAEGNVSLCRFQREYSKNILQYTKVESEPVLEE